MSNMPDDAAFIQREPIAVVGIGCRFPGNINDAREYWTALCEGRHCVTDVPAERFDIDKFYDSDSRKAGSIKSRKGGFVENIDCFDAEFFGYFPAEASRMDPQHRLALETTVHALEDSGAILESVAGSRTSVFFGSFSYDFVHDLANLESRDNAGPYGAAGVAAASLANRISHKLGLQGPSVYLDTACSSSLVAVHLACQSLWTREADAAVAGGANAILHPMHAMLLSRAGFLSPEGACKPFDETADGYVRSEGCGVVYLKPLSRALRDQDRIYSLIRGSLVNSDGFTAEGYTYPNVVAQATLMRAVYETAGLDPATVQYVEAHGTGTQVGDFVEANSIGSCIGQARAETEDDLIIGSVKGNLGHLEGAAGIAGLIKTSLMAYHSYLPPQLKHKTANPKIDFAHLRLAIDTKGRVLQGNSGCPLLMGVNSFGFGGTNAHVIVQSHPRMTVLRSPPRSERKAPQVLMISAESHRSLRQVACDLSEHLQRHQPRIQDVAFTLNTRRSRYRHVALIPTGTCAELDATFKGIGVGKAPREVLILEKHAKIPKLAFAFSGQGGQWLSMGKALMQNEEAFRRSMNAFDVHFQQLSGFSILPPINETCSSMDMIDTAYVQPAIAAIQIALASTLMAYGLVPDAIAGHSIGEIAAAYIAGALTLEQAVKIVHIRSTVQARAAGQGSMLAVGMTENNALQLLEEHDLAEKVNIAALNGPQALTLSGSEADLLQLKSLLDKDGVFAKFVKVNVPYHSHYMDGLKDPLIKGLSEFVGRQTTIDLYSSVTTTRESGTHLNASYWFDNVRMPVRWTDTIRNVISEGSNLVIEIGPHPVLIAGTRAVANELGLSINAIPSMLRNDELSSFAKAVAAGSAMGLNVDITGFNGSVGSLIDLPLYAFQKQVHRFEHPKARHRRVGATRHPFHDQTLNLAEDGRLLLGLRIGTAAFPSLLDHKVQGSIVFPAAGHIEAASLAASERAHSNVKTAVSLHKLEFVRPLVLATPETFAPQIMLEVLDTEGNYVITMRAADASPHDPWEIYSKGRIAAADHPYPAQDAWEQLSSQVKRGYRANMETFYGNLSTAGLAYGEAFLSIKHLWHLNDEVVARIQLPDVLRREALQFQLHPALFDAALQMPVALVHHSGDRKAIYLPASIQNVQICDAEGEISANIYVQVKSLDQAEIRFDSTIFALDGRRLAELHNVVLKRLNEVELVPQLEYVPHLCPRSLEGSLEIEAEFSDMLIVGEEQSGWLHSLLLNTFHDTRNSTIPMVSVSSHDAPSGPNFKLHRRAVIVVCALQSMLHENESFNKTILCLLGISRWTHHGNGRQTVIVLTESPEECVDANPAAAAIEAAVRVMAKEHPHARFRTIDIGRLGLSKDEEGSRRLARELRFSEFGCNEAFVALRSDGRMVRRLEPVDPNTAQKQKSLPVRRGRYYCVVDPKGSMNNIHFREMKDSSIGDYDVTVDVIASGVNYKDVMNVLGLLSPQSIEGSLCGDKLGLEMAGYITGVGKQVHDLNVGDLVFGMGPHCFAGTVVTNYQLVHRVPSSLRPSAAAALPIAWTTAYYALWYVGRLEKGETVLIHSAAGGVGIAAIEICKHFGAQIIATAGSADRRAWLTQQGIEHVFDSRSESFADHVRAATGGRGVDLVLNSLTGVLFSQSVASLAPFGRFLEIGKVDIYNNRRLGLEQFGQNKSFHIIDIDRMMLQAPHMIQRVLREISKLFEQSAVKPSPIVEYPITEIQSSLRDLSRSQIVGKAVLTKPDNHSVNTTPLSELSLSADRSYLVTGGTGGLGLELVRFLVSRGARHITVVSRSGASSAQAVDAFRKIRQSGVKIRIERADVANREQVEALVREESDWPPLAGIIHAVGVLRVLHSYDMELSDFQFVFESKALGALNLHEATKHMALDMFVLISSVSSYLALPGQFSYAAANHFLDALVHLRHSMGLRGLAVDLGLLADFAGMARENEDHSAQQISDILSSQGIRRIKLADTLSGIESALIRGVPHQVVADVNWRALKNIFPQLHHDGSFMELDQKEVEQQQSRYEGLSEAQLVDAVVKSLRAGFATMVGLTEDQIPENRDIADFGSDSITMTQLRGFIFKEFKVSLPTTKLFEHQTFRNLAANIASDMGTGHRGGDEHGASTIESVRPKLASGLVAKTKWLIGSKVKRVAKIRVFAFPGVGQGASSAFSSLLLHPPNGVDAVALQFPGRETRAHEPVPDNIKCLVEQIVQVLPDDLSSKDVFWTHSFGSLLAFEAMRMLSLQSRQVPRLVVLAGMAPQLYPRQQKREIVRQMFDQTEDLDVTSGYLNAVTGHSPFADQFKTFLKSMRNEAALWSGYQYQPCSTFDVPIIAVAAKEDELLYPDDVEAWSEHSKDFKFLEVDASHWALPANRYLIENLLGIQDEMRPQCVSSSAEQSQSLASNCQKP